MALEVVPWILFFSFEECVQMQLIVKGGNPKCYICCNNFPFRKFLPILWNYELYFVSGSFYTCNQTSCEHVLLSFKIKRGYSCCANNSVQHVRFCRSKLTEKLFSRPFKVILLDTSLFLLFPYTFHSPQFSRYCIELNNLIPGYSSFTFPLHYSP